MSSVNDHLKDLSFQLNEDDISFQTLINAFGHEGHYVLVFFLILPFLQPIPIPGLSTPMGLLMIIMSLMYYLKKKPLIPTFLGQRKVKAETVKKIIEVAHKFTFVVEKYSYPRMSLFLQKPFLFVNLLIVVINGLLLALPLPFPFSNALPGWPIFFQSLGVLERDGLAVLISYFLCAVSFLYFGVLGFALIQSTDLIQNYFTVFSN